MYIHGTTPKAITAIVLAGLVGACASVPEEPVSTLTQESQGMIAYETRTLTDRPYVQFASGPPAGEADVVHGRLKFPVGERPEGGWPALIYSHGSGGIQPYHESLWLEMFREAGYATFQVDHFSPRETSRTHGAQASVHTASMMVDTLRAQILLRTHPDIDATRIGVMGSSKGGMVALFTTKQSWQSKWNGHGPALAFHISLYPNCHQFETYDVEAPVFLMHAGEETWMSVDNCRNMIRDMASAGADATIEVYANAHHAFDSNAPRTRIDDAHSYAECSFMLRDNGHGVDLSTGEEVDTSLHEANKACRTREPVYIGGNAKARADAVEDTRAFVDRIGGGI